MQPPQIQHLIERQGHADVTPNVIHGGFVPDCHFTVSKRQTDVFTFGRKRCFLEVLRVIDNTVHSIQAVVNLHFAIGRGGLLPSQLELLFAHFGRVATQDAVPLLRHVVTDTTGGVVLVLIHTHISIRIPNAFRNVTLLRMTAIVVNPEYAATQQQT